MNVHEDYEVRYWCETFGCSKADLVDCVSRVGVMAADVLTCVQKKKVAR